MKKLLAILLAMCMILSMAACSANNTPEETEAGTKPAIQGAGATNEDPVEVELNIMMSFPQYMEQWETYAAQFEAKMLAEENTKVTVNLEMPSSDQYDSVLQTRLTGDDAPDLFTIQANNIATYTKAGYLADLTGTEGVGKVYENALNTVTVDGKIMALPIESTAWSVLYNKDMFEDAGVEIPETLSELEDVCEALTAKGYTPFMLAFQEQWVPQLMTAVTLGGLTTGTDSDCLERMYANEGSYEEVREIFNVINLIMQNGTKRAMEQGSEAGAADFANGAAAMFVQGTWISSTVMGTNPDMNMGVFGLPVNEDPNCSRINLSTSTVLCVSADTENADLAMKFLNYVMDDTDSSALFQACGFNPIASCHEYEMAAYVQEAYAYVAEGRAYQDLVLPSSVTDEQGKLLQELYVGTVTVDQIIERLDAAFEAANAAS